MKRSRQRRFNNIEAGIEEREALRLVERFSAKVSDFKNKREWSETRAVPVDLEESESIDLVRNLERIMDHFIGLKDWGAASSNNVYWTGSPTPIQVIRVPKPKGKDMITLVNPTLTLETEPFTSYERCGSIDNVTIIPVPRATSSSVVGYTLGERGFEEVSLVYGLPYFDDEVTVEHERSAMLQHEVDHLVGTFIYDRSNFSKLYGDRLDKFVGNNPNLNNIYVAVDSMIPPIEDSLVEDKSLVGWRYAIDIDNLTLMPPSKVMNLLGKKRIAARVEADAVRMEALAFSS